MWGGCEPPLSFMLVIIGSGPSIVGKGLGPWINGNIVVRLKSGIIPNAKDWGCRTDIRCASSISHKGTEPFWILASHECEDHNSPNTFRAHRKKWMTYFEKFKPKYKMSTGLRAIFCAAEFGHTEIGLAGFDNLLYPTVKGYCKWNEERHKYRWVHDVEAEHNAAFGLGLDIKDVTQDSGRIL